MIEFLSPADARPDLAFPFYVLFTGISYIFDRDIFVVFFNSIVTFYMTIVAFEIYDVVIRKQQVVVSDKSS